MIGWFGCVHATARWYGSRSTSVLNLLLPSRQVGKKAVLKLRGM